MIDPTQIGEMAGGIGNLPALFKKVIAAVGQVLISLYLSVPEWVKVSAAVLFMAFLVWAIYYAYVNREEWKVRD